jgi:hypothetical protein
MAVTVNQYNNYQDTTSDSYLIWQLETVIPGVIREDTGVSFSLTNIDSSNTDFPFIEYEGSNHSIVSIGTWQKENLDVKIRKGTEISKSLVINEDYELIHAHKRVFPAINEANPVVAIKLTNSNLYNHYLSNSQRNYSNYHRFTEPFEAKLYKNSFLRITGINGYSNGYPQKLNNLLYEITEIKVKKNLQRIESQGRGNISSEKSRSLSQSFSKDSDISKLDRGLALSVINDPQVQNLLNKYLSYNKNPSVT